MSSGFGGFNFGAPSQSSTQQSVPSSGFSFGAGFGSAQSTQPSQATQQPQQSQPAPSFTFGAPATSVPNSNNAGSAGSGFNFMSKQPVSGFGGFGQATSATATTTAATTMTTNPTSAPVSFSFGASTAPSSQSTQSTLQTPALATAAAGSTSKTFTFGKPADPTAADKEKETQPLSGGTQVITDARLIELEGKKVSAILDNLYTTLLKDLGTANRYATSLMNSEREIELLEDMMTQFSSKLTYIQQKQFATEESLRKLYELQCDVLDIVKKMEDYSQRNTHPLTHAINTVENNLTLLEQRLLSTSVINREVLEVYQGLQKQISLIAMLEAAQ